MLREIIDGNRFSFQAGYDCPNSTGIPRAPAYSGFIHRQTQRLRLRGSHPLRLAFPIPFN